MPDDTSPSASFSPVAMRPADEVLVQMGLMPMPVSTSAGVPETMSPLTLVSEPSLDPIIQYYIVDHTLEMSAGKLAAQAAHAATLSVSDLERRRITRSDSVEVRDYEAWLNADMRKVVLRGNNRDLLRLEEAGGYAVRDNGRTELVSGSLTVVALRPMPKSAAAPLVKRLQVYKG